MSATLTLLNTTTYPDALANDGSAAAYYVEIGTSDTVVLFLDGGGFGYLATEDHTDYNLLDRPSNQISSDNLDATDSFDEGILSSNASLNPLFYEATRVKLCYLSSDLWSQDTTKTVTYRGTESDWEFRGQEIVRATIDTLINAGIIATDSTVILCGSSAGGIGVLHNWRLVETQLWNEGVSDCYAISDAGFILDGWDPYTGTAATFINPFVGAIEFWGDDTMTEDRFYGQSLLARMSDRARRKLFIVSNQSDSRYLSEAGLSVANHTPTVGEAAFMLTWRTAVDDYFTDTYEGSCFIPHYMVSTATKTQLAHTLINTSFWNSADMEVDSTRIVDAVTNWLASSGGNGERYIGDASGNTGSEPPDQGDWWTEACKIAAPLGVYDAYDAATYNEAISDRSGNGAILQSGVVPTFSLGNGLVFDGVDDYLIVPFALQSGDTFGVRYKSFLTATNGDVFATVAAATDNANVGISVDAANNKYTVANGGYTTMSPAQAGDTCIIVSGGSVFLNGVRVSTVRDWSGTNSYFPYVGARNQRDSLKSLASVTVMRMIFLRGILQKPTVVELDSLMRGA